MLVLTRRLGESIIIGDGIAEITVLRVNGDRIRLGIQAPKEVRVMRKEVQEATTRREDNATEVSATADESVQEPAMA